MLVVVVDDDEGILRLINTLLGRYGIKTWPTSSAEEFYTAMRKLYGKGKMPDAVLLDIMMPEISGYEVLEEMKKYKITRSVPVIAMTAARGVLEKLEEEGREYDGFLAKPFSAEELKDELDKVVRSEELP